jgi:hypothetical protein
LFVLGATVEELFGVKVETKESISSKSEFEKQVEFALIKMIKNGEVVLSVKKG